MCTELSADSFDPGSLVWSIWIHPALHRQAIMLLTWVSGASRSRTRGRSPQILLLRIPSCLAAYIKTTHPSVPLGDAVLSVVRKCLALPKGCPALRSTAVPLFQAVLGSGRPFVGRPLTFAGATAGTGLVATCAWAWQCWGSIGLWALGLWSLCSKTP